MNDTPAPETLGFQAEVRQLLRLMIHSLYSNREIFLRELISNASDAADRLRFEAIAAPALLEGAGELAVRLAIDREAGTLTIADNGIGLSRDEVVANLGTIARSGTREFFERLTGDQQKDAQLIGQFGVGFYSAFIVAKRVTVNTRRAGLLASAGVRWQSGGEGEYTLQTIERESSGTEIVLELRDDAKEFLDEWKLKATVRRYSDHIALPIFLGEEKLNAASALWTRPKAEVTDEQYGEFYRHVAHDFEPPLAWTHGRVEGRHEYTVLLYLPSRPPFDLRDRRARHGVRLYVKRVFIMEEAEHLLPAYLRFVRGVIDSADLPLNVSREILQQSRDVEALRAGATRRVLSLLEDLAENAKEKYERFWSQFGAVLKEGLAEDAANRERLARLARFASTRGEGAAQTVSLADYLARMKPAQKRIYYLTAESHAAAASSPHLELFRQKDVEVLLLPDPVDEWVVASLAEFEGRPFASVARGTVDLAELAGEAGEGAAEAEADEHQALIERIASALGERVQSVRASQRLVDSAACLVADEHAPNPNLARILKAMGQAAPQEKPILEVNPRHPLVQRLAQETAKFDDWAVLLYEQALLAGGGALEDPAAHVRRTNEVLLALAALARP